MDIEEARRIIADADKLEAAKTLVELHEAQKAQKKATKEEAIKEIAERLKIANRLIEECSKIADQHKMLFYFDEKKMVLKPHLPWDSSNTCWSDGNDIDYERDPYWESSSDC